MNNLISLSLAGVVAAAIIAIGTLYLVSPQQILGGFGLKPPAADADTLAWLRLKGVRDIAAGLLVFAMMLVTGSRSVGIAVLALATIPFGDMSVVLASGGSRSKALLIHGVTGVVMLLAGRSLIHAI